ncbi:sigma-E processing peptidase SpoIIGA [Clostridium merdae]|uniref:sigma-E processing peptidase SpoIIGA n=1 Tax=Clostridium merdae TaxID=1958780 RepID=UPI000A26FFB9|nr:sigma-E processing peptidase SpoIIGA [Clostridium merdae]
MKQIIYVDVLVAVNLFVNYFLLLTVAKFFHISASRLRMVLGAAVGAFGSLIILLPPIPVLISFLIKLVLSALIVITAFGASSWLFFFRTVGGFFLTSFGFAGAMLALWYLAAPSGMILKNSVLYFNISPLMLLALTVVCYAGVTLLNRLTGQRQPTALFCYVTIYVKGKSVRLTTKIDTGNSLKEPFSGYPVMVAEYHCIEELVPNAVRSYLMVTAGEKREEVQPGLRLVPFRSVGGEGVLPAFRPDCIEIQTAKERITVREVYLAVSAQKLGTTGFSALLNPELMTQGKRIARKEISL